MVQPVCHKTDAQLGGSRQAGTVPSHRFLRGLIDGMRCGIAAADRSSRLVMLNEVGRQILGLHGRAAIGRPVSEALAGFPQLSQVLTESFSMSSLPNRAELDIHPPGAAHAKTIGFTLSMIDGEDGEPIGSAVFFKDLTRIEHTEEQERLKERLAALGQMAASLAHEIRNPLASIEVTCSLLRRRIGEAAEGRDLLDKIAAEVRRLNRTITSSLEFVRPLTPALAPGDLAHLLDEAIAVAIERRGGPDVEVLCRVQDDIPRFLMDRGQLRQVFENLLILNALRGDARGSGTGDASKRTPDAGTERSAQHARTALTGSDGTRSGREFDHYRGRSRSRDTGVPASAMSIWTSCSIRSSPRRKHGSGVGLVDGSSKIMDSATGD